MKKILQSILESTGNRGGKNMPDMKLAFYVSVKTGAPIVAGQDGIVAYRRLIPAGEVRFYAI